MSHAPLHRDWHIDIDAGTCVACAGCVSVCPTQALDMHGLELRCADPRCIGCDLCVRFCPVVALALEERTGIPAGDGLAH
jgi:formate hydrogenlyase subunit 6/NADH:ubiquinone oxidoreductase subunit I